MSVNILWKFKLTIKKRESMLDKQFKDSNDLVIGLLQGDWS